MGTMGLKELTKADQASIIASLRKELEAKGDLEKELAKARATLQTSQSKAMSLSALLGEKEAQLCEGKKALDALLVDIDGRVKRLSTLEIRRMQPLWRKRMLAKNVEIQKANMAIQGLLASQDRYDRAKVNKAIDLRDQAITGMYIALTWCSKRPEFAEGGTGHKDWMVAIQPMMDRLDKMVRASAQPMPALATPETSVEMPAGAPQEST